MESAYCKSSRWRAACGPYSVAIMRSLVSMTKATSDGYMAIAGTTRARKNAERRAACDARRTRRPNRESATAPAPAAATATGNAVNASDAPTSRTASRAPKTHETDAIRRAKGRRVRQMLGNRVTARALKNTPACSRQ